MLAAYGVQKNFAIQRERSTSVTHWSPSPQYRTVAEANRAFYAKTARRYDTTESCVVATRLQHELEGDLDRIVGGLLVKPASEVQALDACGGSGNVARKLSMRGMRVTLCDVSPELLDVFRSKQSATERPVEIVCAEIGDYLASAGRSFDLIVFSSALHHLAEVPGVLTLAFERLNPGGLLYTVFDPTSGRDAWTRALTHLDYIAFKLHRQPTDLPAGIMRHLRRKLAKLGRRRDGHQKDLSITNDNVGELAEYHAARGLDDVALVRSLREIGFDVLWHHRYPDARYAAIRRALRWLNKATEFKLLVRKPLAEAR